MKKHFTKKHGNKWKNMKTHHTHTNPHQYSSDIHHQKLLQVLGSFQLTYMEWMFYFFQTVLKKLRYGALL